MNTKILILLVTLLFIPKICAQSISDLEYAATYENDPCAMTELGKAYATGKGVDKNYDKAKKWFQKAADLNYPKAQYNMGQLYRYGHIRPVDYEMAAHWFKKAVANNHTTSCIVLGKWYYNGKGPIKKNINQAKIYLKDAALRGNGEAANMLGYIYGKGLTGRVDSVKTLYWLKKAIDNEYYDAYYHLGLFYELGTVFCKNPINAYIYFSKGAEKNVSMCQYILGKHYIQAEDNDYVYQKEDNIERGIQHLTSAANSNLLKAQIFLAQLYSDDIYVEQNIPEAIKWYEQAYENKDSTALSYIIHWSLQLGDYPNVYKWCKIGESRKYPYAIRELALCYLYGKATQVDYVLALKTSEQGIEIASQDPDMYDTKGEILYLMGKKKQAYEMWETVKKMDANFYSKRPNSVLNKYMSEYIRK